jgi:linoleoyl-CoA desaturase
MMEIMVRILTKLVNKFMGGTIYILPMYTTGRYNITILHHTYTNIPGHDEDLDGRINDLQKMQNGILSIASTILPVFLYGLLTFNWAILLILGK